MQIKELEAKVEEYESQNEKLLEDKQDLNIRMTNLQKEFAGDKDAMNKRLAEKDEEIEQDFF